MTIVQCTDFKIGHVYRLHEMICNDEGVRPNSSLGFRITVDTTDEELGAANLTSGYCLGPAKWQPFLILSELDYDDHYLEEYGESMVLVEILSNGEIEGAEFHYGPGADGASYEQIT